MTHRKQAEERVVITKTYDLILWSCHHTGKFARNHRFVLGERIERKLYNLSETLIQTQLRGFRYSQPACRSPFFYLDIWYLGKEPCELTI